MTANPKLVIGDVFVAHDEVIRGIDMHDRRELFHLETLRIDGPHRFLIEHRAIEIKLGVVSERLGHE